MRLVVITLCLLLLRPSLIVSQEYSRIINGSPAKPRLLPYQVALYSYFGNSDEEPTMCGGTIISKRWILTAAHCLQEPGTDLVKVIVSVGAVNKTSSKAGHVEMVVNKNDTIVHHLFDRYTVANDIGLIRLWKDLELNKYVQAAKLPKSKDKNNFSGRWAITSGWGVTAKGKPTNILQYIHVKIITNNLCERMWNNQLKGQRKLILDSFLCIDSKGGLPCRGDSGGPLVLTDGSSTLVGVVSHGYDAKCRIRMPDIFTRVSFHVDWIEHYTGRL